MQFSKTITLPQSPAIIWPLLFDIPTIASLIPGCKDAEVVALHKQYTATLTQKLGPFKINMPSVINICSLTEPTNIDILLTGRDAKSRTDAKVHLMISLTPIDGIASHPDSTELALDSDIQIVGKLATLGYPIVKHKCNAIFDQFSNNFIHFLEM